jgi:hypothetical protein
MRSYVFIILSMAMILLMIMSSPLTTIMAKADVSHQRNKRFLFGYFSSHYSTCRKKGKRCFGVNSMCWSGHCKHIVFGSDRCS